LARSLNRQQTKKEWLIRKINGGKKMNIIAAIYIVFGVTMGFSLLFITLWIAGKDIVLAFMRKLMPRGCDVYIANPTRNVSHYYKVPKDGIFKIKGLPYITNPEKTINLTAEERERVMDYVLRREERLKKRIAELDEKKKSLEVLYNSDIDEKQKFFLMSQISHYKDTITNLNDKLRLKQENYFKDKRPAFFYIEGDPIPKDFYEYYSLLDSKMVDNLVSRSISQPPSKKQESDIHLMKLLVIGAAIAAAAAAFFAFRNNGMLGDLCRHLGAACKM
jgi:hypothetical protein